MCWVRDAVPKLNSKDMIMCYLVRVAAHLRVVMGVEQWWNED
jgi:hypothetical protein